MLTIRAGAQRLSLLLVPALLLGVLPTVAAPHAGPAAHAAGPAPRAAAALTVNPVSATAGTTVTLTGADYHPATNTFTPTVTAVFTDANGVRTTFPPTTTAPTSGAFRLPVQVPLTAATGPAQFSATDISGTVASAAFDVRPASTSLGATPSSGVPGITSTITGAGFATSEPITLTFTQGTSVTTLAAGTVTTTNTGLFTTTVTIPGSAAAGVATVTARDRDSNSGTTPFTVVRLGAPTVALTPSTTIPASTVAATGTNFAANQPITLTFGEGPTSTALVSGTVATDASGAFTTTTTIPSAAV